MLRVRTVFSGVQGAPWLSTMMFYAATEDQAAANAAVSAVGAFWTAVRAQINSAVSWATQAQVDGLDTAGNHTGAWNTTPATNTGSAAGNMLPPAVQLLCQWRTGTYVNNREIRGRTNIPGLGTVTLGATGNPTSTAQGVVNTAANALLAAATVDLVVWDRTHGGYSTVASGSCWGQYSILRSRRD